LFFTTVGSDTLKELRESYKAVSDTPSVHSFYDMHDIGDVMLHCGFQDPVVDKEIITVQYKSVATLLKDLKGIGSFNLSPHKSPGCMTPRRLQRVYDAYEKFKNPQGFYPVTYEIIYGHAMSPTLYRSDEEGIVHIPANKIPVLP
jgi:malonyl-CoA O-methyltransferase